MVLELVLELGCGLEGHRRCSAAVMSARTATAWHLRKVHETDGAGVQSSIQDRHVGARHYALYIQYGCFLPSSGISGYLQFAQQPPQ